VWDTNSHEILKKWDIPNTYGSVISYAYNSIDNIFVIMSGVGGVGSGLHTVGESGVKILELSDNESQEIKVLDLQSNLLSTLPNNTLRYVKVEIGPDGTKLAVIGRYQANNSFDDFYDISVVDLSASKVSWKKRVENIHSDFIFSPDGNLAQIQYPDGYKIELIFFDVNTGQEVKVLKNLGSEFIDLTTNFSPNGDKLLICGFKGNNKILYIWELDK
jgi:Tol biopolymer transport system component